jgi:hypothetical protein
MLFIIKNTRKQRVQHLRTITLVGAYACIKHYKLHATEMMLDQFLQQQYGTSLKNMCIKLLLNLSFYEDDDGNLVLLFKNNYYDTIASLITYGNGAIPGSGILRQALKL